MSEVAAALAANKAREGDIIEVYKRCPNLGRALIVSVHEEREEGADKELTNARESLELLGFEVQVVVDPTKRKVERLIREHRDAPWSDHSCSLVAFMAHGFMSGGQQFIFLAGNEKAMVTSFINMLATENAPELEGKPKLWFVQACRGGGDRMADDELVDEAGMHAAPFLSTESDQLQTFSAVPDRVAIRGVFWEHFREICSEASVRATPFVQLVAKTNQKMAVVHKIGPPVSNNTLRDALISAKSLTL